MFRKVSVNSEEFIFYIDLLSDFIKKKTLIKGISSFIKEKDKFNTLSSYGIVLFQEKGSPLTTYDKKESEPIANVINENWETRETKRSFLENGLFEILSYVFRKIKTARKNYRVVIISDTPSSLSDDYHSALYDLLIKARKFDTFIDIIRLGDEKFYDDDVKLKVIVSETHGGVFYCNDSKLFQNILGSLVQSKTEFNVIHTDETDQILEEDKAFYEKLAVDLISLDSEDKELCDICEQELCPICEAHSDEVHKCFNCNVKYHSCCAANYSIANNIGFKHLFRCAQCDTLLKLDEEFVNLIYEEEKEEEYEEITQESEITEISTEQEEIGIENVNPLQEDYPMKKIRVGGYFGQEITIKPKISKDDISKVSQTVISIPEETTQVNQTISITNLRPPRRKTINLCKICGTTLRNVSICPNCGARVD